jgi:peroxiredoxin
MDGQPGPAAPAADGGTLTGEQMLASPAPWNYPQVQAALDEWLHAARPPIEDGTPWHYTEWGVMENGVNVRAVHPDNQGMTRHQYLWERCRRLTSAGHCTLGDYVRLRLTGGSLDACRGTSPARTTAAGPARAPVSGERAPLFVARTVDGKRTIRLEDLRGKTVLLNLWNPGSPADRAQYAYLNDELGRLQQAGSGMVILSVAPSAGGLHPQLRDALAKVSLRIAELYPDSSVVVPYAKGLQATPATYVIDSKGIVRNVVVGSLKTNHAANVEIENLLGIGRR